MPRPPRQVPMPLEGVGKAFDRPQRVLFMTWGVAVGLRFLSDVRSGQGAWPCPGRYWKISGLYVALSLFSEVRPDLAMMLGVGFLIAFMARQAQLEVPKGTYFGVPLPGR